MPDRERHGFLHESGDARRNGIFKLLCASTVCADGVLLYDLWYPIDRRGGGAGWRRVNAAELADKLMSILSNDIFPCFQTITSPDAFFTQVSHRALFAPHECRISDVFVQRLRLATAFYEKRYSEIPEICGEYMKVLADAPYLTSGCKKIYLDEVRLFQNAMAMNDPEKETLMAEIIRKTGRACFGL